MQLPRMHPHMLRHTFVATMIDAGVDVRDVQIATRHADPRTTMRSDRGAQTPITIPILGGRCGRKRHLNPCGEHHRRRGISSLISRLAVITNMMMT